MKTYQAKIGVSVVLTSFLCFLLFKSYSFYITGMNPIFVMVALLLSVGSIVVNWKIIKSIPIRNVRIILRFLFLLAMLAAFLLIIQFASTLKKESKIENMRMYTQ